MVYVELVIGAALVGWFLWRFWMNNRVHWTRDIIKAVASIPHPKAPPIIGNVYQLIGSPEHMWNVMRGWAKQYPRLYVTWATNRCAINMKEPEDIEFVLSSTVQIEKSELYNMLSIWLGQGLLISGGAKWKTRRRILTPAFHFHILKQFVNIFEEHAAKVEDALDGECDKESTLVIPIVLEYALHSLCETTMGTSSNPKNTDIQSYKQAIHRFGLLFLERLCKPWIYTELLFRLSGLGRQTLELVNTMQTFTSKVITERLETWDASKIRKVETASGKERLAMLDLLITQMKEGADIDYEGIREEVDTFMFEGHDTTSMAMSLFLLVLASHPEIQDRIVLEQKEIFGNDKRKATYDDLHAMSYLECCIKESLRIYPPVPFISRRLSEELKIKDYTIPANVYVHIHIYDVHHNPKYWPNPEKFDPDRFLPENSIGRHPFSYLPFSAGSRNCIGQRFAMLEIKSFASHVLRRFILEPVDTPETVYFRADLVLRPQADLKIRFRKRV